MNKIINKNSKVSNNQKHDYYLYALVNFAKDKKEKKYAQRVFKQKYGSIITFQQKISDEAGISLNEICKDIIMLVKMDHLPRICLPKVQEIKKPYIVKPDYKTLRINVNEGFYRVIFREEILSILQEKSNSIHAEYYDRCTKKSNGLAPSIEKLRYKIWYLDTMKEIMPKIPKIVNFFILFGNNNKEEDYYKKEKDYDKEISEWAKRLLSENPEQKEPAFYPINLKCSH